MKTYCKNIDITNVEFIIECIYECLHDKWNRRDVVELLSKYTDMDEEKIHNYILLGRKKDFEVAIRNIAEEISDNIKNRTIVLPPIEYVERKDSSSNKIRVIGIQKIIHQFYEYVAVNGAKELFNKKIGVFQCASIPDRGQSYGKKAIKKWLYKDKVGTRFAVKGDVKKCYPSINRNRLKNFLRRDIHNPDLLYLIFTLVDAYEVGLSIGSHLSQWLCNYYLSYAYHYISEQLYITKVSKRTGKNQRVRLISHVIFYMDDILIFGSNKKYLFKAFHLILKYFDEVLDLVIKPDWRLFAIEYMDKNGKLHGSFVDMMGYRFYRDRITIRRTIYFRAKRKCLAFRRRIKKHQFIYKKYAQTFISYWGWVKNTNSFKFMNKYEIIRWVKISKRQISHFAIKENQKQINRIIKLEEYYNVKSA